MNKFDLKQMLYESGFRSQSEFAKKIGKSEKTVSLWFTDNSIKPSSVKDLVYLMRIANVHTNNKYQEYIDMFVALGWIEV